MAEPVQAQNGPLLTAPQPIATVHQISTVAEAATRWNFLHARSRQSVSADAAHWRLLVVVVVVVVVAQPDAEAILLVCCSIRWVVIAPGEECNAGGQQAKPHPAAYAKRFSRSVCAAHGA